MAFNSLITFLRETGEGKTLFRILFNQLVRQGCASIGGDIVDLGAGKNPYYHAYFRPEAKIVSLDLNNGQNQNGLTADLDKIPLPLADNSFDNAIFFNVLELIRQPEALIKDVWRIIKPGGRFYFSAMLITFLRPEPGDYVRWTEIKIREVLTEAGFKNVKIIPIGERATAAVNLTVSPMPLRGLLAFLFKLPFYISGLVGDKLIPRNIKAYHPSPIGYFCSAEK